MESWSLSPEKRWRYLKWSILSEFIKVFYSFQGLFWLCQDPKGPVAEWGPPWNLTLSRAPASSTRLTFITTGALPVCPQRFSCSGSPPLCRAPVSRLPMNSTSCFPKSAEVFCFLRWCLPWFLRHKRGGGATSALGPNYVMVHTCYDEKHCKPSHCPNMLDMSFVWEGLTWFITANSFGCLVCFRLFCQIVFKLLQTTWVPKKKLSQSKNEFFPLSVSAFKFRTFAGPRLSQPLHSESLVRRRQPESALMHSLYDCLALSTRRYIRTAALVLKPSWKQIFLSWLIFALSFAFALITGGTLALAGTRIFCVSPALLCQPCHFSFASFVFLSLFAWVLLPSGVAHGRILVSLHGFMASLDDVPSNRCLAGHSLGAPLPPAAVPSCCRVGAPSSVPVICICCQLGEYAWPWSDGVQVTWNLSSLSCIDGESSTQLLQPPCSGWVIGCVDQPPCFRPLHHELLYLVGIGLKICFWTNVQHQASRAKDMPRCLPGWMCAWTRQVLLQKRSVP